MYLVYKPEGSEEEQRWEYNPRRIMSAEREALEKRTGKDFSDFTKAVANGNSGCRRALLHMYLKREHPTLRYEDVDFAWDELTLVQTRAELVFIREQAAEHASPDQREAMLAGLDQAIAEADDGPGDEGKVLPPIVA
ncbi:hypothetical protein [Streptomyces sp. W1SF4]|uniref:hypothetical protein n=1 Tax=Streptomyces sp. W1SF4 TaxID=2305220 RepID=UPI000F6D7EA2|nr:hypothetical protein [Streptomyces sp. W1SF4]AZM91431.1 hypothetical protein D1J60_25585 [Streptomyces sp. W1SF4]